MDKKANALDLEMTLGEDRIKSLHDWILRLCDPDENFCQTLMPSFETTCQSVLEKNYEGGGGRYTELSDKKLSSNVVPPGVSVQKGQDGLVYSTLDDGSIFEGNYKKGVPHGYFRCINSYGDVDLFCCFVRGIIHGVSWRGLPGGGFLVSPSWDFSSDSTMYLYPDCRTVLFGNFYKGQMVSGKHCAVVGSTSHCSFFCGVMEPVISKPKGKEFSYDPSTDVRISSEPLLCDPYETEFVLVGPSTLPGAGEGLFAKLHVEAGTVVSFYNGTRVEPSDTTDISENNDYRIVLDEKYDLDIPIDMISLTQYSATLAHKVCHSFTPNCEFDNFYHPRFGFIKSLTTLRDIKEGDELFVNYRYSLSVSPTWYKVAWAKHQKIVRRLPNWKLAVNFGPFKSKEPDSTSEEE